MWHVLRRTETDWTIEPEWPVEGVRYLLVWNPCDGYHIWSRGFTCPPGTHYSTELPAPPEAATTTLEARIEVDVDPCLGF